MIFVDTELLYKDMHFFEFVFYCAIVLTFLAVTIGSDLGVRIHAFEFPLGSWCWGSRRRGCIFAQAHDV